MEKLPRPGRLQPWTTLAHLPRSIPTCTPAFHNRKTKVLKFATSTVFTDANHPLPTCPRKLCPSACSSPEPNFQDTILQFCSSSDNPRLPKPLVQQKRSVSVASPATFAQTLSHGNRPHTQTPPPGIHAGRKERSQAPICVAGHRLLNVDGNGRLPARFSFAPTLTEHFISIFSFYPLY